MNHKQTSNPVITYFQKLHKPLLVGIVVGFFIGFSAGFFSQPYIMGKIVTPSNADHSELELSLTDFSEVPPVEVGVEDEPSVQHCVDVAGAVMAPGVYCLDKGDMVVNAILKAGDINYKAYAFQYVSKYINYARKVRPNEKIYIPFAEEYSCTSKKFEYAKDVPKDDDLVATVYKDGEAKDVTSSGKKVSEQNDLGNEPGQDEGDCININSATVDELISLPGIGAVTAQNIASARPFSSIEQLLDVSGIGQSKYNQIKDLVCI